MMEKSQKIVHIVAALFRRGDEVLLVQQQGPDDPGPSWALPGGVVGTGERLTEALRREVREETGLQLHYPGRLLYIAQVVNARGGDLSTSFIFEVDQWQGELQPADPDGLILEARFLTISEAMQKLDELPWRDMCEPVLACLRGEAHPGAVWLYRTGLDGNTELVERIG